MAQLDKTFPTNDCAMCTISPRLVDTSAHLNIEILTDSEVEALEGEAGAFTATVRTRAALHRRRRLQRLRQVRGSLPRVNDEPFRRGPEAAQARLTVSIHRRLPLPTRSRRRGVAPCRDACPAGQRAQGYIALIREGRYADALRTIKEDNPFPRDLRAHLRPSLRDRLQPQQGGRADQHPRPEALRGRPRVRQAARRARARRAQPRGTHRDHRRRSLRPDRRAGPGAAAATASRCSTRCPPPAACCDSACQRIACRPKCIDREIQDIVDLGVDLRLNTPVRRVSIRCSTTASAPC